jgi:hypothetical protein
MSQYAHQSRPAYPSEQPFSGGAQFHGRAGSPADSLAGKKHMQLSLAFGVIGIFFFPVVFGPLAIVQAGKAERLGEPSNAGRILGWFALGLSVLFLGLFFFGFYVGFMSSLQQSYGPPV